MFPLVVSRIVINATDPQVLSLGGEEAGHPVLVTPVQSMGLGEITCLDVASSGRRIALGTSGGCTVQMYLQHIVSAEEEHDASAALESASISYSVGAATISGQQLDPVINLKSEAIEVPQCPPPPTQRQVSIDDAVIATSYTLLSNDLSELSSSLSTTPRVLGTRMRTPATRRCVFVTVLLIWIELNIADIVDKQDKRRFIELHNLPGIYRLRSQSGVPGEQLDIWSCQNQGIPVMRPPFFVVWRQGYFIARCGGGR